MHTGEVMIAGTVGGREHALGLALQEDTERITFTHGGNGGTAVMEQAITLPDSDLTQIVGYAEHGKPEFVIIGPEAPLVAGLGNMLRGRGIVTFGPDREGAQLEASKAFSAEFNQQYGIRQPEYVVTGNLADSLAYIEGRDPRSYVVKADGLAGGKGVIVPEFHEEAEAAVQGMMSGKLFGKAGQTIVFQRRIDGPEVSLTYIMDGKGGFTMLPLSQDHKRLLDGDEGPNTGGMGAYTPVPFEQDYPELIDEAMEIGNRIQYGLQDRGIAQPGTIYAAAMLDPTQDNKPSIIEINVRLGDPETQVLLAQLGRAGISAYDVLGSAAHGSLDASYTGRYLGLGGAALTVCLANEDYGFKSPKLRSYVHGLDRQYEGVTVHHGGTRPAWEGYSSEGGRILYVTAAGDDIDQAAQRAYAAIGEDNDGIWFHHMHYRADIGWQARTQAA